MIYIKDIAFDEVIKTTIGGKAKNLYHLKNSGLNIPSWIVIPQDAMLQIIPEAIRNSDLSAISNFIADYHIENEIIEKIVNYFPDSSYFAVRSSAADEDGIDFSFAGQFESYLYVTASQLAENIKKVWLSAFSERVIQYRKNNKLKNVFGIAVIIQKMVNAEVAGVAFGINPINGDRNARLISAVFGLGEGLVSGELNADNYIVKGNKIEKQIADKTHLLKQNIQAQSGTIKLKVEAQKVAVACLNDEQVFKIVAALEKCNEIFNKPQDIEFAFENNELFLLQARPITNLNKIADSVNGDYILWDNSNIIESYPGVTTPLTFSFISKSYESAYKIFCEFLGVSQQVLVENERVFANTLGLINGRVYYNLKSWYYMLAMLPGYSINARFMENMMGVKERFDIPESYRLSKAKAWLSMIKIALKMYTRFLALPKKRKEFMILLNATIAQYKAIDFSKQNANELMNLYLNFEKKLLNEWKAPLLNDFFAMVWFGILQKRCKQFGISKNPNIHNDLLCGSSDIISTQPIHRSIALASEINNNKELKALFINNEPVDIWKILLKDNSDFTEKVKKYIDDFGERCIGELKLESVSYTQNPPMFINVLKSYVLSGITEEKTGSGIEEHLRKNAEKELNESLKYKPLKKWRLKQTLKKARILVSSRENLRYDRTRAFGIVRAIFSAIGKNFYAEGIIENDRDIFYLTKDEIFSFIEGTSVSSNVKELIILRKKEFLNYEKIAPPSERFASYGAVYHANDFYSIGKLEKLEGDLKGIGCCPGRIKAKVRIVLNPREINSLNGDILVTSSTDPGWVTLFPSASAIIVERGSLLSHSAIVSREMGIPCIVGVTGLLKRLKTGDEIEMDGSTGEIKILKQANEQ